jgi:alpha-L-arabinofuranosidase B-like protein/fibronectin type III domain protein
MAGEAPSSVAAFPNAPGMVTITWIHSGDDVFWFVVELESSGSFWIADKDKRVWTITGLQPGHTYRFRVCAVHAFDRDCSEFTAVTTFPQPDDRGAPPPPPAPPEAAAPLPAFVGSFEAVGQPGMLARHRNGLGELSGIGTDLDRADATFRIHPIGNGDTIRLEASNYPGQFLRHQNFRIHLHRDDGTELFRQDSTFRTSRRGTLSWTRLESVNYPGHFVRHRNFELWVDTDDRSALFAEDSAWRRLPPPLRNVPPGAISIQSDNYPGRFVRHRDSLGFITPVITDLDRRDATFVMRKALLVAGDPVPPGREGSHEICVSLESVNYPGHFLRHQNSRLKLHQNDGTLLFRQDASFMFNDGGDVAGNSRFSLESINFPGHFVRHSNFELFIAASDGSDLFRHDATWQPVPSLLA